MNAPGSPSSPLHTTYLSFTGCFATSAHFLPVGKPAPPRPLSPDFNISSNPSYLVMSNKTFSKPSYPPTAIYSSICSASI